MEYKIEKPKDQQDEYHKYDFVVDKVRIPIYDLEDGDMHFVIPLALGTKEYQEIYEQGEMLKVWSQILYEWGSGIYIEIEAEDAPDGMLDILGWLDSETYETIINNYEKEN